MQRAAVDTQSCKERMADAWFTLFLYHMVVIFVPEITQGGEYRVWSSLPEPAQSRAFNCIPKLYQGVQVFLVTFTFGDAVEDMEGLG